MAAAPALAAEARPALRSGIGIARTTVPTAAHAPGTVPYFPPAKPAAKVEVTNEVFKPWSFAVTDYGIHGKEVPRPSRNAPASPPLPEALADALNEATSGSPTDRAAPKASA